MAVITPESFSKRSFIYRQFEGASFSEVDKSAIALSVNEDNDQQAKQLGLLDLSVLSRVGVRGKNAEQHMKTIGLPIPTLPNTSVTCPNGDMVLRLGQNSFWVLANIASHSDVIDAFEQTPLPGTDCYSLYCQNSHVWFAMTGNKLAETMAKVCGIDLRTEVFPVGSIVQTSVGKVSAIIVHHKLGDVPVFSILSESTVADYLWVLLLDAMMEFGGRAVGLKDLIAS